MYACLGVTCRLHFWQNDQGLLCATAVTNGVERTLNKSQHIKLTLEMEIVQLILLVFATFQSQVQRSYKQDILAPYVTL